MPTQHTSTPPPIAGLPRRVRFSRATAPPLRLVQSISHSEKNRRACEREQALGSGGTVMSIRTLALSTALVLAAGLAAAQNPQYPWGQPGNSNATVQQNGQNVGYQRGMQDGMRDGQKDQQSGHSFRPTQTDKYKDTPGYTSLSGINHDQYVQLYRQSYMQGYQQGYNANAANNTNSTNRYCDQDGDDCAPQGPPVYGQRYPQQPNYPNGYPASNYPVYGQPGYGQGGQQIAFQRGAQQGQNDGLIAARQGKPGHGNDNYKNTPGYDASMGITFDQYRVAYRQG